MSDYKTQIAELKKKLPVYKELLNKGATEKQVESFRKKIQLKLPDSFFDFFTAFNGSEPYETAEIQGIGFSSLQEIIRSKKTFDEILEEKREEEEFFFWHPDWLPFADNFSYDTLVIDTTGKASGKKGCVLHHSKDSFEGDEICIVAPDFATYVKDWMTRVEKGQVYSLKETDEDGKNLPVEDGDHYFKFIAKVPFKHK